MHTLPGSVIRRRRPAGSAVVAALLVGVLAGCGGGSDDGTSTDDAFGLPDAKTADLVTTRGAKALAAKVRECFDGGGEPQRCVSKVVASTEEVRVVPSEPGAGIEATVKVTAGGFRVFMVSLSGNRFALTRSAGDVVRSCSADGEYGPRTGYCRNGRW